MILRYTTHNNNVASSQSEAEFATSAYKVFLWLRLVDKYNILATIKALY